jgi:3-dehydroquinate dehydratase/shikimate dehydrogenase
MICVTIGRGRHASLVAEWKAAADAGATLVELRLDCLRREPDLKRVLKERHTPVLITIRKGADGGLWRGDEEKRQRILREAIVAGVDYVDLESDIAGSIPRFGKTKRIVSYHNFKKTPADLEDIQRSMRELNPDIVKTATIVHSVEEASGVLDLVKRGNQTVPTVGIAMGPLGMFTRILGAKYGAPLTYAGFNPDRMFAPGMLQFQDLRRDYFYDEINAETEIYGVVGDPIGHSLSPAVHNAAFKELGLNKRLLPFQIPDGRLKEALHSLAWIELKGFSVTIPHKEAVVALLNRSDKAVESTGACNTVVIGANGWSGYNTDYRAAMESLEDALGGPTETSTTALMDKQVLILGAGGVARAIAFGAVRRGAGVTIATRNEERAAKLAADVGCRSTPWTARASQVADIIINCTPVGMHPNVDSSPVPIAAFKRGMVAFDTVYHPENTLFLKVAREHECTTISGVDMFVRQAALQFELYTGKEAPVDLMRRVVKRKLSPMAE